MLVDDAPAAPSVPTSPLFAALAQEDPSFGSASVFDATGGRNGGGGSIWQQARPMDSRRTGAGTATASGGGAAGGGGSIQALARRLQGVARREVASFDGQSLSNVLHSMARLQCRDGALVDQLLRQAQPQLQVRQGGW